MFNASLVRFLPVAMLLLPSVVVSPSVPAAGPADPGGGVFAPAPPSIASAGGGEFRAIWVTGWGKGFKTAGEVAELVSVVHEHNFNAILAEVRTRGNCYYFPTPPNLEPRADDIAPDFDPLAELIARAHPLGIEVHAWIVVYNVAFADAALDPAHVVNVHPEYLTKNSSGQTVIGGSYYLDPGHPGANEWNTRVVMDLVTNYEIDGIHFDYFRYPGRDAGYNDTALARFRAELDDCGAFWPPSPSDEQFSRWRRRQITDWLRATYADILAVKPGIKVTAAVFASESSAVGGVYQDWPAWMGERLLDAVIPMNYTSDNDLFHARALNANAKKNGRHCYMGFSGYQNPPENSAHQMLDARALGCDGFSLFQYLATNSTGTPDAVFYDFVRDHVTTSPAPLPAMPWKSAPVAGCLRGRVTDAATSAPLYNATVTIAELPRTLQTDVEGRFAFIDVPGGIYTIRAGAAGFTPEQRPGVVLTPGTVVTSNFALVAGPPVTPTPTPIPAADVIVDNDDGPPGYRESGRWTTSSSTGFNGLTYRYAATGTDSRARWSAWLEAGHYEIFTIYRAGGNRANAARFAVASADGTEWAAIDQTRGNLVWVPLGRYLLSDGCNTVTLEASESTTSGTVVIADAVRFLKVGDPPPTATPTPEPTAAGPQTIWKLK
ncbi:MAG: hypothetical protein Kow0059_22240 [Candidatus Sumerlaeia bacterium]